MKDEYTRDDILAYITSHLMGVCKTYALSKMNENDFILLNDAYDKVPNESLVTTCRGPKKELMTIKRSCQDKYLDAYDKKLLQLISNFK